MKLVAVHGMERCKTDPCVFVCSGKGKLVLIIVTVHADDMAVAGPREEASGTWPCREAVGGLNGW